MLYYCLVKKLWWYYFVARSKYSEILEGGTSFIRAFVVGTFGLLLLLT